MVVVDASALVDALLINGAARERLAVESLQAPELIDSELLSVLRRLVAGRQAPDSSRDSELGETLRRMILDGIW
jgi:predicted nucleic acid-binding protein